MRQDGTTVDIDFVRDGDIVTENSDILQTSPLAYGAVPADNGRLDPSVVLDFAVLQEYTALQTHTVTHHDVWSNSHVRPNAAVLANLGGRVHHNIASKNVRLGVGSQQLGVAFRERGEVQAGTAEEVLGLADIHPETFKVKGVELTVLANGWEGFLFDGGRAQFDAVENTWVQEVDTGVDSVTNKLDRLLDETVDAGWVVGLVNDDTVLGGLIHLGDDDGSLIAMVLVELCELLEGVIANDIGVEDEEWRVILAQDLLGQFQGACGAQGFGFDGEFDSDVILFLILERESSQRMFISISFSVRKAYLLEGRDHHIRTVVDSQYDIGHTCSSQALNLVQDHRPVSEFHQGLRESQGLI